MTTQQPDGLQALLAHNTKANHYFYSLPTYLRDLVCRSHDTIRTENELHQYADNIQRGLHE